MIISVSRRTDVPAFYSEWFFNRLKEGYVLVRNPMNYHQVSRVELSPELIDCIVFWTKDPSPMLKKISLLSEYNFYFQITVTPYGEKIESGVPDKFSVIETFKQLADRIGRKRTVWRYDPILLTSELDAEYHCGQFEIMADSLRDHTDCCIISFIDMYKKTARNMNKIPLKQFAKREMFELAARLKAIASKFDLKIRACSESIDLSATGIEPAKCIDDRLISEIHGQQIRIGKDKNQRDICGCVASIDIGAYNTCKHGCLYCYATFNDKAVKNNLLKHNPNAPMLIGDCEPADKISNRKIDSYKTKISSIDLFEST